MWSSKKFHPCYDVSRLLSRNCWLLPWHHFFFTDRSKIGNRTGFSFSISNNIFFNRHRKFISVLTTELQTIFQCLESILSLPSPQANTFLVASDSISSNSHFWRDVHPIHPLVSRIYTLFSTLLSTSYTVTLIMVPSHRRNPVNEKVDATAKAATSLPRINSQILPTKADLSLIIRRHITDHWTVLWRNQPPSNKSVRGQEIWLIRLRISHTRLTHAYLVFKLFHLSREHCHLDSPLTVNHMFECPSLESLSLTHQVPSSITIALSNEWLS